MSKKMNETATAPEQLRTKISDLISQKNDELQKIDNMIADAQKTLQDAQKAMNEATDSLVLKDYQLAKEKAQEAENALEMLRSRRKKIELRAFVSEEVHAESVASIRAYQKEIEQDALKQIINAVKTISRITESATESIKDADSALFEWSEKIHPMKKLAGHTASGPFYVNDQIQYETSIYAVLKLLEEDPVLKKMKAE